MGNMEWFYRMENSLKSALSRLMDEDDFDIFLESNTTEFHPSVTFFIEAEEEVYEFCVIQFDPTNQEFYTYLYHQDRDLDTKILFNDMNEMLIYVYESYSEFCNFLFDRDQIDDELDDGSVDEFEEDIVWISNDKHIHIETGSPEKNNQFSIHLKMGFDESTGDGILYRSVILDEDETEEIYLPFKEEEAKYLIDLFQDYMNYNYGVVKDN